MSNPLIALLRFYGIPLTLENFNELRYAGTDLESCPEDEVDTPDEVLICDFCSGTPVVSRYHAQDFIIASDPSFIHCSVGDWGACSFCERLIDAANWETLLTHAVVSFYEHHPETDGVLPVEFVREHLRAMYEQLRQNGFQKAKSESEKS